MNQRKLVRSRAGCGGSATSASGCVGTPERPRLAVFRSSKHIYAQVIDDDTGTTLAVGQHARPRDPQGAGLRRQQGGRRGRRPASSPSGPRRPGLTRSASTADATSITAGSRPWPTPPARRGCNSDAVGQWPVASGRRSRARPMLRRRFTGHWPTSRLAAIRGGSSWRATIETATVGEWSESVVAIRRCAAVVKGGRRFSFNALVVVGDGRGQVAWGYGKANEVPPAVEKAVKDAHKQMNRVNLQRRDDPAPGDRPLRRGAGRHAPGRPGHRREGRRRRPRRASRPPGSPTS